MKRTHLQFSPMADGGLGSIGSGAPAQDIQATDQDGNSSDGTLESEEGTEADEPVEGDGDRGSDAE